MSNHKTEKSPLIGQSRSNAGLGVDIVERLRRNTVSECMSAAPEAAGEIVRLRKLLNSEYENKLNFFNVLNKYWPGTVNDLLEDHIRLKSALRNLIVVEPCDCGCPGLNIYPVKPAMIVAVVKDALGDGAFEIQDSLQIGQTGSAQAKPENRDMDSVCHDIAPSPNDVIQGMERSDSPAGMEG